MFTACLRKAQYLVLVLVFLSVASCLPPADPYPFAPEEELIQEAKAISTSLETHIRDWTRGEASSAIPARLIPAGIKDSRNFYLKKPEEVTAEETWATRFAKEINQDSLLAGIPEPKATYLFLGTAFAPFGSKLIIEGEFPRARFFSFQITAPFSGREYYADRQFGQAEVSLVDADIDPLPGHTNPFRVGADRNAENRSYRIEFDLITGDPVAENERAFAYPYRGGGNRRAGSLLVHQGPLGFKTLLGTPLPEPGAWNMGALWVRIYRPDAGTGPLGGVAMPRVSYELPTGERYFIGSDFSRLQERADLTAPNQDKVSAVNENFGPTAGWQKSWGISRSILTGVALANGWRSRDTAKKVAAIHLGWTGRGEFQAAPANYEPHATTNNYCNYLGRNIDLLPGEVVVLTGKLPTFPDTHEGAATMAGGEVRFWSIGGIDADPLSPLPATTIHSISDDEVIIDADRNYVIVYSRAEDRPANATAANGVTWVDAGTQSSHGLLLRWVSVREPGNRNGSVADWYTPYAPSEDVLTWAKADWAGSAYDSTLIGTNWWEGHMGCFLPRVHRMEVADFVELGNQLTVADVPVWLSEKYTAGATYARFATATATSQLDAANAAANVTDGDVRTTWSNAFAHPRDTVLLALDTLRPVSAFRLLWNPLFFARDYALETSVDGSNWAEVGTYSSTSGGVRIIRDFTPRTANFVRLIIRRVSSTWSSLAELEVYGSACTCPAPGPPTGNTAPEETGFPLRIYPNPTDKYVFLDTDQPIDGLELFSMVGQSLGRLTHRGGRTALTEYAAGAYWLRIESASRVAWRKIVLR